MNLDRINIGSEININFIESDKFKTDHVSVCFISSLENDLKASKNALLAKVLMRGSKNYPTLADISKRLNHLYAAKIGCWVNKTGETQVLSFSADMLENKYSLDATDIMDETLDILGDIITNPLIENSGFKIDYTESEKINLTNDILAQINNKNAYVYQKCVEEMCKHEKFAINNAGTVESVGLINSADLYKHYNYILSNCAVEIFCVGKFAVKKDFIINKFKNLFKNIGRNAVEKYDTEVILSAGYKGETIEEMEVNQGKLAMGFRIGASNADEKYINFILFCAIYGLSPTSKLFENVREKLSLCYYCYPSIEPRKGVMIVLSGIEVENKQKAQDEILKQLEEIKSGNFTDSEIEDARRYMINSFKSVSDSAGGIMNWYLGRLLCGNFISPEEMTERINKTTREDIITAAESITLDTIYFLKGTLLESDNNDNNNNGESEEEES